MSRKKQVTVIACQPTTLDGVPLEARAKIISRGYRAGVPTYAGSKKGKCDGCDRDIFIGPRQQEQKAGGGHATLCWMCAVRVAQQSGETSVVSLGNINTTESMN